MVTGKRSSKQPCTLNCMRSFSILISMSIDINQFNVDFFSLSSVLLQSWVACKVAWNTGLQQLSHEIDISWSIQFLNWKKPLRKLEESIVTCIKRLFLSGIYCQRCRAKGPGQDQVSRCVKFQAERERHPPFSVLLHLLPVFHPLSTQCHCNFCCGSYCHSLKQDKNKNVVYTHANRTYRSGSWGKTATLTGVKKGVMTSSACVMLLGEGHSVSDVMCVWYLSRCYWHLLVLMTDLIWQPCVSTQLCQLLPSAEVRAGSRRDRLRTKKVGAMARRVVTCLIRFLLSCALEMKQQIVGLFNCTHYIFSVSLQHIH